MNAQQRYELARTIEPVPHALTIYMDGDGWMVHDTDPEVMALFGTDTLPLPFLKATPAAMVMAALQDLNPHKSVALREETPVKTAAEKLQAALVAACLSAYDLCGNSRDACEDVAYEHGVSLTEDLYWSALCEAERVLDRDRRAAGVDPQVIASQRPKCWA